MVDITHDWVDGFEEYEAVLVCTNILPEYDDAQVMRAFAIDQWSDATTANDDSSLRHNDFGTIIRHDGGVLAIDFGHGSLNDSLPDLFLALHRLGWREAVVYHPAMTINDLLVDMGRAIPPNLDFDVKAAGLAQPIADSLEGKMLVDSAHRMGDIDTSISHAVVDDSQVILNTFRELGEPSEKAQEVSAPSLVSEVYDVATIEDYEPVAPAFDVTPNVYDSQPYGGYEVKHASDSNVGSEYAANAPSFDAFLPAVVAADESSEFFINPVEAEPAHKVAVVDLSLNQTQSKILSPLISLGGAKITNFNNIKVGNSMFCFDVPGHVLTDENIELIATEQNIHSDVVDLFPGAINAPVRWDFLGEVDLNYPWLVEKLVDLMIPDTDKSLVSSIFMAVIKAKNSSSLRDVLMFAGKEMEEMSSMLTAVSPAADLLLKQAKRRGSLNGTLDQIVQHLGGLALNTESFVDVELADDAANIYKVFTVREVMLSPISQLFIVHVDALDSPFVNTIVNSLQYVASISSESKRYSIADTGFVAPLVDEGEVKRTADVKVLIGSLVEQLQVLGINLNSIN